MHWCVSRWCACAGGTARIRTYAAVHVLVVQMYAKCHALLQNNARVLDGCICTSD